MSFVPTNREYDPANNAFSHVSHFGAIKTSPTHPVLKANFPGVALDTTLWNETTVATGNTVVNTGVGRLNTGVGGTGSVILNSVEQGIFEAGQVTVYQSGVYAGVPVANNIRRWGLMDAASLNGLFFELNGLNFNIVSRRGGVDTTVAQASFSGDQTFTPGASNNTYRIFYSAGRAIFCRASAGQLVMLHTIVDPAFPLVEDLDLGLYYENTNTGNTTDIEMRVRGASSSVFGELPTIRANGLITDSSVMALNKSVLAGRDFNGDYRNVEVSPENSLYVADYLTEVVRGNIPTNSSINKFGRTPVMNVATIFPVDVWNNGGVYTGQPTGAAETVDVFSSNGNDTSAGTGARTIIIEGLDASFDFQSETIIMNGITAVTSVGIYSRVNRAYVVTAGTGAENAGDITIRHTTTTANVFAVVPATQNQSTVAAYTIPNNNTGYIKSIYILMTRANGSNGSAEVSLRIREPGGVYRAVRYYTISNALAGEPPLKIPIIVPAQSDIKISVEDVSDNTTEITAEFEILLINN